MSSSNVLLKSDTEEHIHHLLSEMTIEEKIGQTNQYMARGTFDSEMIRKGLAGSLINASGALTGQGTSRSSSADVCNEIQKLALESRLKIPQLFGRDVIHGYRTVFPIPLAQAAAWNPSLARQAASVAAREATADGIKWTFAPMVDIARDPRWGRVAEGAGEDTFLGSQMAEAVVQGFQGNNMAAPENLVACAKHYVGYGLSEGGRDYDSGEVSEPTLRDVYLPPFHAAVDAGVGTLMSAFMDLNGVPATANRRLLTDVLRGEWGFQGFVVSDWESVHELINHGVAVDDNQASAQAFHAGVDMDMVSQVYLHHLAANLESGRITLQELNDAVLRILRIKHLAGLFENPFTDLNRASHDILTPSSRKLARQCAQESMVLLKNQGAILPISDSVKNILVAGPMVNAQGELLGTWSPDGRAADVTPLADALKAAAPAGVHLRFSAHVDRAVEAAHSADLVVLVLGEHPRRSGENANVTDLGLPPGQAEWVDAVCAIGKPVILVVLAGRPLVISRQVQQVNAVLYAWHPGIEGGAALADLLFGTASPSGRLPITFPRVTGQVPIYYNHKNSGRPVTPEGEFKTRYVDCPSAPLFPFGYGLTYTSFSYANLMSSGDSMQEMLQFSAEITNTGPRPGSELVQLYIRDLVGSLTRPIRELKGFQRISLQPGETQKVSFSLHREDLAFTNDSGKSAVEAGTFHIWIAPDSASGLQGQFQL